MSDSLSEPSRKLRDALEKSAAAEEADNLDVARLYATVLNTCAHSDLMAGLHKLEGQLSDVDGAVKSLHARLAS